MRIDKFNKRLKLWILHSDCYVCGKKIDVFSDCTIEHIVPRSKGGSNAGNNLAASHRRCNNLKGDLVSPEEWKSRIGNGKVSISREFEDFDESRLWRMYADDYLIRKIIELCFFDLIFVIEPLRNFPQCYNGEYSKLINKKKGLSVFIVMLRKFTNINTLITASNIVDRQETRPYWKLIFGILFLEKFYQTKDLLPFLHATWRFRSVNKNGPSLAIQGYANELLEVCKSFEPATYEEYVS